MSIAYYPFFEERLRGFIQMQQGWASARNDSFTKFFYDKVESWKFDARFADTMGRPRPEPPVIPMMWAIDEAKLTDRFIQWENEPGKDMVMDFYVLTPLAVPAGTFDTAPPPPPAPDDDVFGPDGASTTQFLVAQGCRKTPGTIIHHPKYGELVLAALPGAFGPYLRWRKI
jgi:hypothetical protein